MNLNVLEKYNTIFSALKLNNSNMVIQYKRAKASIATKEPVPVCEDGHSGGAAGVQLAIILRVKHVKNGESKECFDSSVAIR